MPQETEKTMNEFKNYHPAVNLIYYVFTASFAAYFMHPICLAIAFSASFIYMLMLSGTHTAKKSLIAVFFTLIASSILNPVFNHAGITIIAYLPSGNPLTLESILYGPAAGTMLVTVVCLIIGFQNIMTSDKYIYLFGKITPSLSLVFSMTLRFIPRFTTIVKDTYNAQVCLIDKEKSKRPISRVKLALNVLSCAVGKALEDSIEIADSMRSRGYGLRGRSAFSIFKLEKRDVLSLILLFLLAIVVIVGAVMGHMHFDYFPYIGAQMSVAHDLPVFIAYFLLCYFPIFVELHEVFKWKRTKSKT